MSYIIELLKPTAPMSLREVRQMVGFSQVEVAERMGVSQGCVSKYERSLRPHLRTIQRFVKACNRTADVEAQVMLWVQQNPSHQRPHVFTDEERRRGWQALTDRRAALLRAAKAEWVHRYPTDIPRYLAGELHVRKRAFRNKTLTWARVSERLGVKWSQMLALQDGTLRDPDIWIGVAFIAKRHAPEEWAHDNLIEFVLD